jgi:hypothetical protein
MQDDYPYSVCEDFVTADTELIPAWYILQTQKKENHVSIYQHFIDCCEGIGLKGTKDFLNQLICLDYLIANEDRHQNNFGVIRNANTLEYIGFAPIYDNGTSMFLSTPTNKINGLANSIPAKPFKKTHAEQIKLVTSFEWINFEKMKGIGNEFYEILSKSDFMDETRKQVLCGALDERVAQLEISNKQEGMK